MLMTAFRKPYELLPVFSVSSNDMDPIYDFSRGAIV